MAQMGLIADEQPAMGHTLKTTRKARTWVPPGRPTRDRGLRSHPDEAVFALIGAKNGESPVWRPPVSSYPAGAQGRRGALPWIMVALASGGTDDNWSLRLRYGRGYRGTLNLPRDPGPRTIPSVGPASAAPMPTFTVARAPRGHG